VIPTFNQERFINRTIASALAQDFPALEVIVADDASTDGTGPTAQLWGFARRFRYVRNERNLGRVANYHRGVVELARGEWVLMLDGDDYLSDVGFIRKAIAALDRHAGRPIVFAQAGHRVHHLNGAKRDVDILPPIEGDECVLGSGDYLRLVFDSGFFTHLGALYHREQANRIGFYTAPISSADMDSLLRLSLEGEVLLLKTVAGCWVHHGGNASATVPLGSIAPNVRIFRQIARRAVREGRATWRPLAGPLRRYEARTLIHLFGTTIGKSARGPLALVQMLRIALGINPRLLGERDFLAALLGFAWRLKWPSERC
jgi:glycosyltransferase involved in cell wall biosynthesis